MGWCGWFGVSVSGLVTLFLEMCLCRLADTNVGAVRVYCVGWLTRCEERLKPGNSTNGIIRSCWYIMRKTKKKIVMKSNRARNNRKTYQGKK